MYNMCIIVYTYIDIYIYNLYPALGFLGVSKCWTSMDLTSS